MNPEVSKQAQNGNCYILQLAVWVLSIWHLQLLINKTVKCGWMDYELDI